MSVQNNFSKDRLYDVIIVGGGPAGLTAAIYLARAKYRVLVIEKEQFGGQITITHEVVNYPGIGKISGKDLTEAMYKQADFFGAEFLFAEVLDIELSGDIKTVYTSRGELYCFGILLATGARPRTVGFKGEEEYKGRGVAYCATCDGEFFTDKEVFVVGGGYAAAEESVFLTKFARHVTILIREDDFTCAAAVADDARNHEKISVLTNTVVEEVSGEKGLNYIRYKNISTGKVTEYHCEDNDTFGVFVFVGYAPATELVKDKASLDEQGYVVTDRSQKTNVEGLYAAGDVCIKPLRQVVTATGDGALAATELEKYASYMQTKTENVPIKPTIKAKEVEENKTQLNTNVHSNKIFSPEMVSQLGSVFEKMAQPLLLKLYLDKRPVSKELKEYISALSQLSEKINFEIEDSSADSNYAPCVQIYLSNGKNTGIAFHGVPGGHEFTSFVLSLYNAAGPGQDIDEEIKQEIANINKNISIKVLVTLSCNMCPELVIAAQRIAAQNNNVIAEVYDINHFEKLKKQYNIMSVPCMVINDEHVSFGKKNITQLLEIIKGI